MKRVVILIIISALYVIAQSNYFYAPTGTREEFNVSKNLLLISFSPTTGHDSNNRLKRIIDSIAYSNNIIIEDLIKLKDAIILKYNVGSPTQLIQELKKLKFIDNVSRFLVYKGDSTLQGLTGEFIVKVKQSISKQVIDSLALVTNTEILDVIDSRRQIYRLYADKNSLGNALEMSNYFYNTGYFEISEPLFIRINTLNCINEPYFNQQWPLKNTGQNGGTAGADINICKAWEITKGRDIIKVAVVDVGVELTHSDLVLNLLPGYDATGNNSGGASTPWDAHGTNCAGIIAAARNGMGIVGVAPKCKIIPVRIAYSPSQGNRPIFNDLWSASGINWAWQNGADVISNSWGGGSYSSLIANAIDDAVTYGRQGLGCVIVFSSGNDNANKVSFPAYLNNVIAVGASSKFDTRESYSNYGETLDVVAPGGNGNITTTTINGSYTYSFSGTSAAAPHVAGIAALVLSVNPCLKWDEVKTIIEWGCDKVGNYCYNVKSNKPNGLWNIEMGYGRVNAYRSLLIAIAPDPNPMQIIAVNKGLVNPCNQQYCKWANLAVCSTLASGIYFVNIYKMEAAISYYYKSSPNIIAYCNGFSLNNPNSGGSFINITYTGQDAVLQSFAYEGYNVLGQQFWLTDDMNNFKFNYVVYNNERTLYLQDKNDTSGIYRYYNYGDIYIGEAVTNTLPYGEYMLNNGAQVEVRSATRIVMSSGTHIKPSNGGRFRAYIEPLFTCSQYPNGKVSYTNNTNTNNSNKDKVKLKQEEEIYRTQTNSIVIQIYPNPATDFVKVIIENNNSPFVLILKDMQGRKVKEYILKKAVNQLNITDIAKGIYLIKIQGEHFEKNFKLIKL